MPYLDDGELLQDAAAHAGSAVVNLPLQLVGSSNLSLLMGAADLTLQDSLLGYPTPATAQVSFILSSPATDFIPPIPEPQFPLVVTAFNSLTEADGVLGLAYAQLGQLAAISPAYQDAFLQMTQALQTEPLAITFALVELSKQAEQPQHRRARAASDCRSCLLRSAACSGPLCLPGLSKQLCVPRRDRRWHTARGCAVAAAVRSAARRRLSRRRCCRRCALHLLSDSYRDRLVWSYPGSVSLAGYHSFALFDLSVCGVNLQQAALGDGGQPVSAVVDTGSSCLSLPAELFDALVSWLPVACSDSADGLQQGDSSAGSLRSVLGGNVFPPVTESGAVRLVPDVCGQPGLRWQHQLARALLLAACGPAGRRAALCLLQAVGLRPAAAGLRPASAGQARAPSLRPHRRRAEDDLHLADPTAEVGGSSSGTGSSSAVLVAALSQLALLRLLSAAGQALLVSHWQSVRSRVGQTASRRTAAASPAAPASDPRCAVCCCCCSVSPPYVSLGSRSLSSLHAVFSMSSAQVGLANVASVSGSNASCVLPVSCLGQQQQDALYNVCVDPSCSSFYFFNLNPATHSCELTAAFHVIAALLIALLLAVELGLNEWLISISMRVQGITSAQPQQHAASAHRSARRLLQQQRHSDRR